MTRGTRAVVVSVASAAAVLAWGRGANAQLFTPGAPGGSLALPGAQVLPPARTETQADALGEGSSRLFDMRTIVPAIEAGGGPLWYRPMGQGLRPGMFEVFVGQSITAPQGHLYLAGTERMVFRALDSTTFAWTMLQTGLSTGVKSGPLELEGHVGLNLFGLSASKAEWSLDVVSPRVGAHAALHFGRFRLEVGLHTEYLLRLMGDDFAIRGVDFALRFDLENGAAKRKPPR